MNIVTGLDGLDGLVQGLRGAGRTVIGPVARGGVITHDEIASAGELPVGWAEEQDAGRYRLQRTGTAEVFAFSSPASSWKRFVYPERTLLVRARRTGAAVHLEEPAPVVPALAFFGIRACDLAALGVLDGVFLAPGGTDPTYAARRTDVFVVAVGCNRPGRTCFCASMGTGPTPKAGFDLAVTELLDGERHEFLIETGSDRGAALVGEIGGRPAGPADLAARSGLHDGAVAAMGRTLPPEDPPRAALQPDHPHWDDVAARCLACGNCTMVCPTCFCSTTEDSMDLSGTIAERSRVWDSCFTLDFTHLGGGSIRATTKSRYRQWLLHKLVTWHDQFGTSGCVGCGRCITWCPVGIDLTAEIAALAQPPGVGAVPPGIGAVPPGIGDGA